MRDGAAQGQVGKGFKDFLLAAVLVPKPAESIASASRQPAIVGEAHRFSAGASAPGLDLRAILHFPEPDGAVFAGTRQHVGIVAPAHVGDGSGVPTQGKVFAAGEGFPNEHAAVSVGAGQQHAIGAVLQGVQPIGVLLDVAKFLAVLGRIDADQLVRSAQRDLRLVGADVGRQHGIGFVPDFDDLRAGLDAPDHGLAGLPAAAARRQQQAAVAAEFQHVRRAVGERQYADEIETVGIVEQYLLLPGHGSERRPGAGGNCRDRPGPWRHEHRLRRELARLRHRRRTFRPAFHHRCQADFSRRFHGHGFAAGVFQCPLIDPLLDRVEVGWRQLVRLRRHVRLNLVREHAVEPAAFRVARLHHRAGAAAFHELGVTAGVEPALDLLGIVAGQAFLAQQGEDVVLVGDFLGGWLVGGAGRTNHRDTETQSKT